MCRLFAFRHLEQRRGTGRDVTLLAGFGAGDLFQLLRDGRQRTRSQLASETGFARSTIASRIDELLAAGLILSVGDAVSTGGRPSSRVALNAPPGAGMMAIEHALSPLQIDGTVRVPAAVV